MGTIHLITAWNPRSEQVDPELNSRRQAELESELDQAGLRWWPASGSSPDGSWREEGAAVLGLARDDALAIGSRWGQDALYELSPGSTMVVWCEDGRVLELPS